MTDTESYFQYAEHQMRFSQRLLAFTVDHYKSLLVAAVSLYVIAELIERRMNRVTEKG